MTPEVVSRIRNMWWNPCNRGKGVLPDADMAHGLLRHA